MRKSSLIIPAIVLSLVAVYLAFKYDDEPATVQNVAPVIAQPTEDPEENLAQPPKQQILTNRSNSIDAPIENEEEATPDKEALLKEALLQYQNWQKAVGFPEIEQHRSYMIMQLEELSLLAASGNIEAKYVYGLRLARNGDEAQSNEVLIDAVAEGSIAAAQLLFDIYSGQAQKAFDSDRSVAYAWQKVAQAMGAKPNPFGEIPFPDPEQHLLAEHLYFEYLSMVQQLHFERYGEYLPFNPQP